MKAVFKILCAVCACLLGLGVALQARAQAGLSQARSGYTCCNFHHAGDWISDANWFVHPEIPVGTPGLPGWTVDVRVQDWEQITVPAGTFRALRAEATGRRSTYFSSRSTVVGQFRSRVWYAPDVKRFARLEHSAWSADRLAPTQIGDEVIELLSYAPPR